MNYRFFTSNELKPAGWLKTQLQIQADGLSGHLDQIWPDVRDSAWIGGSREGWERVPYWLDGFIPLAYLLEDEDKISRAKKYIDAILERQQPDGWICPCTEAERPEYDTWAVLLISKVLVNYYECSRDARIPDALYRLMKNYYELLAAGTLKLFDWGWARWFEGFIALNFLEKEYAEPWIRELAEILYKQGLDYNTVTERWKRPLNKWTFETHVVNLAMMLKAECVSEKLLNRTYADEAEKLWDILMDYNGTAAGIFTGDECLSGQSPIQGTELCAVVEMMYSFELLYAATGDVKWAERLEKAAFNALPATISDDMWAHQYDQMANQIACIRFPGKSLFRTNGSESHLFGLEPNFGCCTANFNQGWPKFALSAFLYRDGEILSAVPVPSELQTEQAHIVLKTDYPFENQFVYEIEAAADFDFRIRIPSFAQNLHISGHEACDNTNTLFRIKKGEKCTICVKFDTSVQFTPRPHDMQTVTAGSLVYALPVQYRAEKLEYERDGVERKAPYCDYEYIGESEWRYAYVPGQELTAAFTGISDCPFSSKKPPVTVQAKVQQIDWDYADGYDTVAAPYPESAAPKGEPETVTLVPYGTAKLRMTELPFVDE